MQFASPGPIILELGPLTLRWYGLLYAIAFFVVLSIAEKYLKPKDVSSDELNNFAIIALVSGLVGARLWYVLLNYQYFLLHLDETYQIWLGGQSIQGGMIGAWLGTLLLDRKNYLAKLATLITVIPLAQAIARWGNFFNEEAYGSITDLPWKLYISHTGTYHHPTFLYESIWNLLVFFILFSLYRKIHKPLIMIGLYLILYSLGRFFIEMLRTDSLYIGPLPAASLMSVIGMLVGLALIVSSVIAKSKRS